MGRKGYVAYSLTVWNPKSPHQSAATGDLICAEATRYSSHGMCTPPSTVFAAEGGTIGGGKNVTPLLFLPPLNNKCKWNLKSFQFHLWRHLILSWSFMQSSKVTEVFIKTATLSIIWIFVYKQDQTERIIRSKCREWESHIAHSHQSFLADKKKRKKI